MFEVIKSIEPTSALPKGVVPAEIHIELKNIQPVMAPTHMLAVRAPKSNRATLFPCHSLVLATNCSRLAPFDAANPVETLTSSSVRLPVRWMTIPDPAVFSYLLAFLYLKTPQTLFTTPFLPGPIHGSHIPSVAAAELAQTYSMDDIMKCIPSVWGLWADACTLGVMDTVLYNTIDQLWEILLLAVSIKQGDDAMAKRLVAAHAQRPTLV